MAWPQPLPQHVKRLAGNESRDRLVMLLRAVSLRRHGVAVLTAHFQHLMRANSFSYGTYEYGYEFMIGAL